MMNGTLPDIPFVSIRWLGGLQAIAHLKLFTCSVANRIPRGMISQISPLAKAARIEIFLVSRSPKAMRKSIYSGMRRKRL